MMGDGSGRRRAGMAWHRMPAAPQPPRAIHPRPPVCGRPPALPSSLSPQLHPLSPSSIPEALKEEFLSSFEGWGLMR